MRNKYKCRNKLLDLTLGLAEADYELQPTEARVTFWVMQGNYPQLCASIELFDGIGRRWGYETDSSPICRGNAKIEALISLKKWIHWRHPSVEFIISDFSEIKGCYPTYIREKNRFWDHDGPRYTWVGTWLPI